MTREEAIIILDCERPYGNCGCGASIEEIEDALDMAIKALEEEPRWIPVSERLPEENKTVIASTKYGVYSEARYTKEDGWEWAYESGADYWVELEYVTAWMPLPEPYKAESMKNE